MHKERFYDSFENFRIYKDLYGKPCKYDWVAHVFFSYTNASNFRLPLSLLLIWLKIVRLHNFNVLFQPGLTNLFESELFSCLQKLIT